MGVSNKVKSFMGFVQNLPRRRQFLQCPRCVGRRSRRKQNSLSACDILLIFLVIFLRRFAIDVYFPNVCGPQNKRKIIRHNVFNGAICATAYFTRGNHIPQGDAIGKKKTLFLFLVHEMLLMYNPWLSYFCFSNYI